MLQGAGKTPSGKVFMGPLIDLEKSEKQEFDRKVVTNRKNKKNSDKNKGVIADVDDEFDDEFDDEDEGGEEWENKGAPDSVKPAQKEISIDSAEERGDYLEKQMFHAKQVHTLKGNYGPKL